jgi:hypothetical protein
MQSTHKKADRELSRFEVQEPSTYEIYNLNSTELDVSVSAQLAVKLIESPVPPKHNQPKVSFPKLVPRIGVGKKSRDSWTNNSLQQSK